VTRRLSVYVLAVLIVGLALHNVAMATLWEWGVRGTALDVVSAWKEALLAVGLGAAIWHARRLPALRAADLLAAVYAAIVVLYALIPQGSLEGAATTRGELLALRHHLTPVAAYALGRLLVVSVRERRVLVFIAALVGVGLTLWGLVDVYAVPLQWWRDSGVPGWYREQLGLDYRGLSGLPENWVFNTGDEDNPLRRLVSTFLSPLATAYVLVVVLILLAARRPTRWTIVAAFVCYVGLLWTHTRAALLALAVGLLVLALLQRRSAPALAAVVSIGIAALFVQVYPTIGPSTSYTPSELAYLRANAARHPGTSTDALSPGESSLSSHWHNLRDGVRTIVRHPQGYGLGNTGVTAKRTGVEIKAGESTFTELGVDAGLAGAAAFVAWSVALLVALRRRPGLAAAFAAVLFLGLQSDVIGVHWLAFCLWAGAGVGITATLAPPDRPAPPRPARPR
jgi:O-Antigen ligase